MTASESSIESYGVIQSQTILGHKVFRNDDSHREWFRKPPDNDACPVGPRSTGSRLPPAGGSIFALAQVQARLGE